MTYPLPGYDAWRLAAPPCPEYDAGEQGDAECPDCGRPGAGVCEACRPQPAPSEPITVTADGLPSPDRIAAVWRLLERLAKERLAAQPTEAAAEKAA